MKEKQPLVISTQPDEDRVIEPNLPVAGAGGIARKTRRLEGDAPWCFDFSPLWSPWRSWLRAAASTRRPNPDAVPPRSRRRVRRPARPARSRRRLLRAPRSCRRA